MSLKGRIDQRRDAFVIIPGAYGSYSSLKLFMRGDGIFEVLNDATVVDANSVSFLYSLTSVIFCQIYLFSYSYLIIKIS